MKHKFTIIDLSWIIYLLILITALFLSSCGSTKEVRYITQKDKIEKAQRREVTTEIVTKDTLMRYKGSKIDTILVLNLYRKTADTTGFDNADSVNIKPVIVEKKDDKITVRATITEGNKMKLECLTEPLEILIEQYRKEIIRLENESTVVTSSVETCPPCPPKKVHWTYTASRWIVIVIIILLFIGAGGGNMLSRVKRVVFGIWKF